MIRRKRTLHIGNRSAIRQLRGDPRSLTTPAGQLGHDVFNAIFRATHDHRAPAMAHDINGDLPTHAGTAADNNDLLGLKMHIRGPLLLLFDGSDWTAEGPPQTSRNPTRVGPYRDCTQAG